MGVFPRPARVAYIGLGANLGDRLGNMRRAASLLEGGSGLELTGRSSLYETAPLGPKGQPSYYNGVLRVETRLSAWELWGRLQEVERVLGRRRTARWGARTMDCDLLLLARSMIACEGLTVPHPELTRRPFVLVPLLELAPGLRHPLTGLPLRAWLHQAGGDGASRGGTRLQDVRLMEGLRW
ncbi:MAG: 2-amino-4-hydroxy-6-hydroxymethyldihydropteridine diphosphokinase [Pseudomonadota bacterium]